MQRALVWNMCEDWLLGPSPWTTSILRGIRVWGTICFGVLYTWAWFLFSTKKNLAMELCTEFLTTLLGLKDILYIFHIYNIYKMDIYAYICIYPYLYIVYIYVCHLSQYQAQGKSTINACCIIMDIYPYIMKWVHICNYI